ncbi:type IVB secretion system protein IcmH/DotU [Teredinibacter turnerae]|uniref:type IVB secretion system protein IcmH/DotU n=1 Tax=Teredinibacter turnerae TaxID=2426 RepID=UPI0003638128|nr:type IVB secretion system protein IcmH/DotU [Teredinibacter turnerae]
MSNNDRTVFRQPTPGGERGGDRTVMRPRSSAARPAPRGSQSAAPQRHQPATVASDPHAAQFANGRGLNTLVSLAATLLAVYEKTRHSMTHADTAGLHKRLCNEIRNFEVNARDAGIRQEVVISARYVLCSILDEAVLNTPWGSESAWAQRSLLSVFHNETSGGEKFFLILDRVRQSPAENIDMLELFYVCLSMGFEGKFRLMSRGRDGIEQIRDDLFSTIRRYRGEYERDLSTHWQGLGRTKKTLAEYLPVWVAVVVVGAVLLFGFSGFRYWLYERATPVVEQLNVIALPPESAEPENGALR